MTSAISILISINSQAQLPNTDSFSQRLPANTTIHSLPDSIKFWITRGCKYNPPEFFTSFSPNPQLLPDRLPVLKIHGTIQYDFTYRSLVDTPFSQRDYTQHTLQATMDFVVKDKYPLRVTLLERR